MRLGAKDRILHTAQDLFSELGYSETTYRRIAQGAQVPEGLIAHHFGSKDNLFAEVALGILKRLTQKIDDSLYYSSHGMSAAINFCKCFLRFSTEKSSGYPALLRCSPFAAKNAGPRQQEILDACAAIALRLQEAVSRGIKDKSIRRCDPGTQTEVIIAALIGATRGRLLNLDNVLHIKDPEGFYRETIICLAAGLSPEARPSEL